MVVMSGKLLLLLLLLLLLILLLLPPPPFLFDDGCSFGGCQRAAGMHVEGASRNQLMHVV